jgi:hypothetical protein
MPHFGRAELGGKLKLEGRSEIETETLFPVGTEMPSDETPLQKWRRETDTTKYRAITRGPRKGMLVRKTKAELRKERIERARVERETRAEVPGERISPATSKSSSHFKTIPLALLFCFARSFVSYVLIPRGLAYLRLLPFFIPLIFVDFVAWRVIKKPMPHIRYLPFLWWL